MVMNKIWMAVAVFILFVFKADAQVVSSGPIRTEINQPKEPKFSVALGFGNSYKFKDDRDSDEFPNMDNSGVSSIRLGYDLSKYVEIEGERSKNSGFVYQHRLSSNVTNRLTISATTLTLNIRAGIPIKVKDGFVIKPYFVKSIIGGGSVSIVLDYYGQDNFHASYNVKTTSSKIGVGIEMKLYKDLSLFGETSHWRWKLTANTWDYSFTHSETIFGVIEKF
jgi:hypothetical protein